MDRSKSLALCCLLGVACSGDPEPPAADGAQGEGAAAAALQQAPVIERVTLEPSEPRPGQRVTAQVTARDAEGDKITLDYRWRVAGHPVPSADGQPSLHVEGHPYGSSIEVRVVARDEHGESPPTTAHARVGNLPPSIVQVELKPSGEAHAGTDITASPIATDPEGGEITFQYHWRVNGSSIDVEGATLPAKHFARGDTITLEVVASDGLDESESLRTLPIEVVNAPPRIVSSPGGIGADGIFRYAVRAEDPDGDRVLRYRLLRAPEGMRIGFDDGRIEWDPPADAAGTHEVEVAVEDLQGARTTQLFALELSFALEPAPPASQEEPAEGPDDSEDSED